MMTLPGTIPSMLWCCWFCDKKGHITGKNILPQQFHTYTNGTEMKLQHKIVKIHETCIYIPLIYLCELSHCHTPKLTAFSVNNKYDTIQYYI